MIIDLEAARTRKDSAGLLRLTNHNRQPVVSETADKPEELALEYLRELAPVFDIPPSWVDAVNAMMPPGPAAGAALHLQPVGKVMDARIVTLAQTYSGVPLWRSGITITIHQNPLRLLACSSTVHADLTENPPERITEDTGSIAFDKKRFAKTMISMGPQWKVTAIGDTQLYIYKYSKVDTSNTHNHTPQPELPDPPPHIQDGRFYFVHQVLFSTKDHLPWLALVEVASGAILFLQERFAHSDPNTTTVPVKVFKTDPLSDPDADLNTTNANIHTVNIQVTTPPANGQYTLTGPYVRISDSPSDTLPQIIPAESAPANYLTESHYSDITSDDFAAVNAYYHCHNCFQKIDDLGFNQDRAHLYWGTAQTLPVTVDYRNAKAEGSQSGFMKGGIGGLHAVEEFLFARRYSTRDPEVRGGSDARVVWHEFGHAILYWRLGNGNFSFSHGCGDSLAAVLCDPESELAATSRWNETFPWTGLTADGHPRSHGLEAHNGEIWGDPVYMNNGSYFAEELLSSIFFRFYRAIGGDDFNQLASRQNAADTAAYLLFRAVASLTPISLSSPPQRNFEADGNHSISAQEADRNSSISAQEFETALESATHGDWLKNGSTYRSRSLYGKVLHWAFDLQKSDPPPQPLIDVYINDGRDGGYQYQPNWWSAADIVNTRHRPAGPVAALPTHQEPVAGRENYIYVRVKNRGTQDATGVMVKGFHCTASAGGVFPTNWQALTAAPIAGVTVPARNGTIDGEHIVGPFLWTPGSTAHISTLFIVSCPGDPANIDLTGTTVNTGSTNSIQIPVPAAQLVPHDNNIAVRNMTPIPRPLRPDPDPDSGINPPDKFLRVTNQQNHTVDVHIEVSISSVLRGLRWTYFWQVPANRRAAPFPLNSGGVTDIKIIFISRSSWARRGQRQRVRTPDTLYIIRGSRGSSNITERIVVKATANGISIAEITLPIQL